MGYKKFLVEAQIIIDPEIPYYIRGIQNDDVRMKKLSDFLEMEANEIKDFVRDHRSMDGRPIRVQRKYETQCEFCYEPYTQYETTQYPFCCQEAQDEWDREHSEVGQEKE